MNAPRGRLRIVAIGAVLMAIAIAVAPLFVSGGRTSTRRDAERKSATVPLVTSPNAPVAAEAQVFRTSLEMLSIGRSDIARRGAHPRTLATYRRLRAYPGAPPRIPHGLTALEFREGACTACHERGGFSLRFNAYVPVTPHPEMRACLQCHVGDAQLMAIAPPTADPNTYCRQCHVPGGPRASDAMLTWKSLSWPLVMRTTVGRTPPPIPHDAPMRVNCLACHAGPSGVAEIRTTHPERANCRQCHVQGDAS